MECNNIRAEGKKIPTDSLEQKVRGPSTLFKVLLVLSDAFLRVFYA